MTVTKDTTAKTVATKAAAPADVPPATKFEPSGAPLQTTSFDVGHPAVDNDPRANTTAEQNRIDFNDPNKPAGEVVAEQLGMKAEKAK